jgi:hypothetical protein
MKTLILTLALSALAANAQSPVAEHAAATVASIHDAMLDPASFVLDGAYTTKPDKHGAVSFCYAFRSHNAMGGYSEERAVEGPAGSSNLSITGANDEGRFPGYDVGWVAPCKGKNLDRDITAEVKALAPSLYRKDK